MDSKDFIYLSIHVLAMSFGKQATHSTVVRSGSLQFILTVIGLCVGVVLFIGVLGVSALLLGYSMEVVVEPVLQLTGDIRESVLSVF